MFDYLFANHIYEESYIIERSKNSEYFFGLLFERYYNRIIQYCKYHNLQHNEAEDICSQVFMTLVDKIKDFEYSKEKWFEYWIFRIAFYHISKLKKYTYNYIEESIVYNSMSDVLSPNDEFDINQTYNTIVDIINNILPSQQKQVFLMRFWEWLSNKEISRKLNIPEKHISSILTKWRKKIRNTLKTTII